MNMMSTAAPWDLVAEGYAETTMRVFGGYIDVALELVGPRPEDRILDVACVPGTLALAAAGRVAHVDALDFSENMIAELQKGIAATGVANITPRQGDGQALPYADGSFDAAFSLFGLMFFPDRAKGYAELYRTLKPGGRACVSSWAPVADSPLMQAVFGALRAINPDIPESKTDPESLENPDVLSAEIAAAGFREVAVHGITKGAEYATAAEFWEQMVKGSAPVLMMKNKMGEEAWREKSKIAVAHIDSNAGPFPATLNANAWLGVGVK
uniref:SAM-dependent methyltransferase n=1 Tax=uncultured miscellaneous Crenarchaeota group TaxID=1368239 RepID=W8RLZ8_9ARCH|nr:SAM-dependent methyltransferase [uncultured miscellaneous Crenarchaeota group]